MVAIVAAQEFQKVFVGVNRSDKPGVANFDFPKVDRRVSVYYFYVLDPEFGPGFIELCSYFPYPGKVWQHSHAASHDPPVSSLSRIVLGSSVKNNLLL